MATRHRKKQPGDLVSFTSRISHENREWIREHADMIEMSQAAWFDGLLTSIRQAEAGLSKDGGLFDAYGKKIEAILDRLVENKSG